MSKRTKDKKILNLINKVEIYNPNIDKEKIISAWKFAKMAHTGQKRLTGEAYVLHPLAVAKLLCDWRLDTTTIIAALLHDSIEEGGATRKDIVEKFGEEVAHLVDGVTKVTELRLKGSKEREFVENLRKMLLVMAKDLRVVFVKLADRLHNMRTLDALPKKKQRENARETLEIYAPLAERFGIGELKGQLEDLAFPYVYPEEYKKVLKSSKIYYKKAGEHIEKMRRNILKKLAKENIKAEIHAREKHLYSLWSKLERPGVDWDYAKIFDIVALRILVEDVPQCYTALGVVHSAYKPIPKVGLSDFIAQPKPNGYQSIHTKVFGLGDRIVEIQIRTFKMHSQAEFGVAAHWAYSEEKEKGIKDSLLEMRGVKTNEDKVKWVRQLVEWQKEITDTEEFIKAVKFDALTHRNFVFSPKGDVFDLPSNATPVDFAYAVHTDLGNYIKSAKVDGKIVPLNYKLKSGDIVEIIKTKNKKKLSQDWLDFVVTTAARRKITQVLRKQREK